MRVGLRVDEAAQHPNPAAVDSRSSLFIAGHPCRFKAEIQRSSGAGAPWSLSAH